MPFRTLTTPPSLARPAAISKVSSARIDGIAPGSCAIFQPSFLEGHLFDRRCIGRPLDAALIPKFHQTARHGRKRLSSPVAAAGSRS